MTPDVFQEIPCPTAASLLQELSPSHDRWLHTGGRAQWIFRGQEDSLWKLQPSAFRGNGFPANEFGSADARVHPATLDEQLREEARAINDFASTCMRAGLPLPEDGQWLRNPTLAGELFPMGSNVRPSHGGNHPFPLLRSIYALAQHHGIPTRLLDWSFDPHVAAYFACKDVAKALALGKIEPEGECSIFALRKDEAIHMLSAVEGYSEFELVEVTAPYDANPNLRAQRGTFTLVVRRFGRPSVSPKLPTIEDLLSDYIAGATLVPKPRVPTLLRFDFPKSECRKLLRFLADLNITAATIYPGYDGATKAVAEICYYDT